MNIKRNIIIMYAISFLQGMIFYGPIATLYRQSAGLSIFQITVIESISFVLCILLELPWGIIADKIGYKMTMIFCCILYFISKIVFWRADGFLGFLIERIMLSVVTSGLSGVDISILYMSCDKKLSQKVFGIYNNLNSVGLIFAAGIYSIISNDDYRLAGFLTVISYGIAAVISLGIKEVKHMEVKKDNSLSEFKVILGRLLKNKYVLLFLISIALLNETHQTITVFLNQIKYVQCGLSNDAIAYIYIFVTICGLLGCFSADLTNILGERLLGKLLFISCIITCFVLTVTSSAIMSVGSIILLRISFSLFQPLQQKMQNEQIVSTNRATALSLNAIVIESVAVITNVIFGKLADIDLSYAMSLGMIFCIVAFILFSYGTKNIKGNL